MNPASNFLTLCSPFPELLPMIRPTPKLKKSISTLSARVELGIKVTPRQGKLPRHGIHARGSMGRYLTQSSFKTTGPYPSGDKVIKT